MPTKKSQDRKMVSAKQYHEPAWIAKRFKVKVSLVREVMLKVGKNGKPSRSRGLIYKWFLDNGYELHRVNKVQGDPGTSREL